MATVEELQERLRKAEEAREKLRTNLMHIKTKIIDTSQLVSLYQQSQAALKKAEEELQNAQRETQAVRAQLEQASKEAAALKEKARLAVSDRFSCVL